MEHHAADHENDKDQVGAIPVAAQEGVEQEEKIPRERVPHSPEPAKAPFREAFPDHPEHHLARGHIIVSPAAKVLSECDGCSACQHGRAMRYSKVEILIDRIDMIGNRMNLARNREKIAEDKSKMGSTKDKYPVLLNDGRTTIYISDKSKAEETKLKYEILMKSRFQTRP
jgi:hypothetical protein